MSIETIVYTLPAAWASALVNDDRTGLDADEIIDLNRFMKGENLGSPVNVSDNEEFNPFHDARGYGVLPCDCLEYTFYMP
jgi:hypothetical protein